MRNILKNMSDSGESKQVLLQPENQNKKYEALFHEIDSGQIKLPMFQREFVWDKEQSAKLIDSILKGFPIGTFIFWKTRDELRSYKEIGNHKLPETPQGDYAQYILDGQQRITSLYAIRKGLLITKDGKQVDYQDIFIDLNCLPEGDERIVVTERTEAGKTVSVHDLLSKPLGTFFKVFDSDVADRIEAYKTKLTSYDFSTITIKDYPIETACEIFARINTGGKQLTVFEIMVAKTFDESKGFDLSEQYEILRDGSDEEKNCLTAAKFETIPPAIIMQCVTAISLRDVRSKTILKIPRETFIGHWEPMKKALFMAIDFIRTQLRIPVSQLLPYHAALIPIAYFFHKTGNKKATHKQAQYLEQFFYWVGLTERYSATTESKIAEDFNRMDAVIKGELPTYPESELIVYPRDIAATWFSAGRAYCKIILCLLAQQAPMSFDTNGSVLLDNSNLKIASSRNYHHFFPKNFIDNANKRHGTNWEANLIANITLIDGYSNKHLIGKTPPSQYIAKFGQSNPKLDDTLKTHLITNKEKFGILTDDYDQFIQRRAESIAAELNEKLVLD